jgi:trimeric autotransporter adhesin
MPSTKRKLQLLAALTVLLLCAVGVGCKGFFVNPTLTTITVDPPSPQVSQGSNQQMTATGTYDDGSVSTSVSNLTWSSTPTSVATINASSGLLSGVSVGSATVTASSANITGTTTVTVVLANVTSIQVAPSSATITSSQTQPFTATATVTGQTSQVDITGTATWTITVSGAAAPSGLFGMTFTNNQEVISVTGTPPQFPYVVTVNAAYPGNNGVTVNGTATLTISQ